jgi:tetratricopeptide (TPR) repeat protein
MSKRVRTSLRASNKGRSLRPKAVVARRSLLPGEVPSLNDAAPPSVPERLTVPEVPAARLSAEAPMRAEADEAADTCDQLEEAAPENEANEAAAADPLADALRAASARSLVEDETDPRARSVDTDDASTAAPVSAPEIEAAKIEEPAADANEARAAGEAATAETKGDAGPAEVAEPPSRPEPVAVQATAVEAEDEAPPARKSGEDLDASGVSAEFFRDDEASLAPTIEDVHEEAAPRVVLSAATVARRARFRRAVAGVVAFTGVISLAVIGKSIAAPRKHAAVAALTVAAPAAPLPPVEAPKAEPVAAKVDAPPAGDAPPATDEKKADDAKPEAKADEAPAADDKKADDKKADDKDAKADDKKVEPAGEPDPAAAKKLQQETLALLNRGRSKEAIEKAREAIAADPTDAIAYLYLGSALQDSGHWKDGIEAYSECVRHATKGSVNECRVMGGHK